MTGEQLETEFGDILEDSIDDYIQKLRAYTLSLAEGTAEWKKGEESLAKAKESKDYLLLVLTKPYPFQGVDCWAAFTVQGLA